ncbi:MAG: hypothetical protein NVSMB9_09270 [Isosphaeraceae bacterium]
MIESKCPVCAKLFRIEALAELPTFPFCSSRCRLIDLGRWVDGAYAIPGEDVSTSAPHDGLSRDEEFEG